MADLNKLTISEAKAGLRDKKFSSVELTRDCFTEIKKRDKDLNAFVCLTEEEAIKSAENFDKKMQANEKLSDLAGIPVGVKDIYNTKGIKTTCCSPILKYFVPPYDASVITRLKENGMVMVGKTNMDEFACGASTEYSCFGVTKNPYDLDRVAGGSSGGSAAALAADMCLYSLGTDTGGSIRQPASFCGVYGMKVTYGRVSRSGVTAMASSWDTIGPFAKCPDDVADILQVIAGSDGYDSTTPNVDVPNYADFLKGDVKGLRIGLPKEYFGDGIEDETAGVVREQVKLLEKAGAHVEEISLPMTKYAVAVYYITMPAELSANLERFDAIRYGKAPSNDPEELVDYYFKARGEGFGDEIKRRIMIGTYVLSAGYYDAYYKKAQRVRTLIIEDFNKAFEKVDVLIGPVSPFPSFKVGELADDPLAMYMADALTIPASSAGLPSLACPAGMSKNGLPIGLQVIAPQFEEGRCIQVAKVLEGLK
ncbi:Asp-tRNA(Asn)/Glu-tRNA(Gln) amidotransferase subunit GatA [Candidatus Peregrinibacteria bacterium]|jgi:aspartyl-tRNA(Asn)/glutamyl-tRNA(Gln) amidotransferase subunit A|nr:Asp-tRNA(Asn)/Glu-tRNA(Gln) amidotransferase subunit GatA [Candidatus Peregrinibacteria bacterium]MBT7736626.1 Asp-tRNA(Asn)/Glu-tRNA(Gln) amidotransferase subunit GatA [Candidatus Peregrinibacteria bacterium]